MVTCHTEQGGVRVEVDAEDGCRLRPSSQLSENVAGHSFKHSDKGAFGARCG